MSAQVHNVADKALGQTDESDTTRFDASFNRPVDDMEARFRRERLAYEKR